ncbi:restriction endonuclease subunit S [Colwellia sp. RE-S-Sl-9]
MLGNNIENIPEGWIVANIEDIADIKTGSGDTQDKEEGGKYPFYVRSNTIERVNSYSFDGEGVLTSGDGVGVGKIYHYVNGKIHYHQRVYNIHNFKDNVLGRYFYEYFRHNFYSRVMRMSAKGSVDSVRLDMIAKMSVLIPSIAEQEKIADILSSISQKVDLIDRKIKNTHKLKKGLTQKLFLEGVGSQNEQGEWISHLEFCKETGKPACWKTGNLIEFLELKRGYDLPTKERNAGKVEIIGSNGVVGTHSESMAQGPGIITGRSGTIGKVIFSKGEFWPLNTSLYVKNFYGNDAKFCFYFLEQFGLAKHGTGTGVPTLNRNVVHKEQVSFPNSIKEQEKIASILDTVDQTLFLLRKQKEELTVYSKGLMQKLLSGEWRVNLNKAA